MSFLIFRLKFESPSYTSSLSAGSVVDRGGRGGPRASTAPEGFAADASAEEKGSRTTFQLKPELFGRKRGMVTSISTAPKRAPNPQLDFGECKSQPMLMAVNKVVMESSTGRKSRCGGNSLVCDYHVSGVMLILALYLGLTSPKILKNLWRRPKGATGHLQGKFLRAALLGICCGHLPLETDLRHAPLLVNTPLAMEVAEGGRILTLVNPAGL